MRTLLQGLALTCAVSLLTTTAEAASIRREIPLHYQTVGNRPVDQPLGLSPKGVQYDGLYVWVANYDSDNIMKFDAVLNKWVRTITLPAGSHPTSVIFDGTYIWAFTASAKGYKYDPANCTLKTTINLSGGSWGAAFDGEYIWVATQGVGNLDKIDVRPGQANTVTSYQTGVSGGAVVFDGTNIWVAESAGGVAKVDRDGNLLFYAPNERGGSGVCSLVFDGSHVWVSAQPDNLAKKIDPNTNTVVATVTGIPGARCGAFDGTYLWLASHESDSVVRIDVRTNQITDAYALPAGTFPYNVVFDGTHMWVSGDSSTSPSPMFKFLVRFN